MIANGTTYNDNTPPALIDAIERARIARTRVRVFYGDSDTGRDWCEEYDTTGYIGRSTGSVKIPLLVHNSRSLGGSGLSDDSVVKLMSTSGRVLYQHPRYNQPACTVEEDPTAPDDLMHSVLFDGQVYARFSTRSAALRYVLYMTGQRMSK